MVSCGQSFCSVHTNPWVLWVVSTQSGVLHVLVCTILLCVYILFEHAKKNCTHVKKVGNNSEFLFGIYLLVNLKNNYLLKMLKWANKKCKDFNISMLYFFKKIKKNISFYNCVPKILII